MPGIEIPPSKENDQNVSSWVLQGNKEDGFGWAPYESSSFALTGSLIDHFEIVPGTSGNVLRWKDEFDEGHWQANYLITQNPEGKFDKTTWLREGEEMHRNNGLGFFRRKS